jgi:hypothetical protein
MKTLHFLIVCSVLLLSGYATVQDKINMTEQLGVERVYDYPYNKVFYACEDALPRINWEITESNYTDGYIYSKIEWQCGYLKGNGSRSLVAAGIKIRKIDDRRTAVKVLKFNSINKQYFYEDFFHSLDNFLNRE